MIFVPTVMGILVVVSFHPKAVGWYKRYYHSRASRKIIDVVVVAAAAAVVLVATLRLFGSRRPTGGSHDLQGVKK